MSNLALNTNPYLKLNTEKFDFSFSEKTSSVTSTDSLSSGDKADISLKKSTVKAFESPDKAKPVNGDFSDLIAKNEKDTSGEIRFFFFSDVHTNFTNFDKFAAQANKEKPSLILDGGDIVHDGTEPEFLRAYSDRKKIDVPVYLATGNHDAILRGPFSAPPPAMPEFQSFDSKGIHFILIDNEDTSISEKKFALLEKDLEANKGKPIVITMHVPPMLSKEKGIFKLAEKLPVDLISHVMPDKEEVKRFHALMDKYDVSAVLTGHTHAPDYMEKDGVKYINVGATGGIPAGWGIDHEYIDISMKGKELEFKRVTLRENSDNPIGFLAETFKFNMDVNKFNHDNIGWNYLPTSSVQIKTGGRLSTNARGSSFATTITPYFEHTQSEKAQFFGDASLAAGPKDLNLKLEGGYKYHVLGDYNKGLFLAGAVGANAGIVVGKASAGVGAEVSAGIEYKNFTFELGHEWATNYKATTAEVGFRF